MEFRRIKKWPKREAAGEHSDMEEEEARRAAALDDKDILDKGDLDLKVVLAKKPGERQRWLTRMLKIASDGQIKHKLTALFDILAHRKFAAGLDAHMGRRMHHEIVRKSSLFSVKQQQFLKSSNWPMEKEFGKSRRESDDGRPTGEQERVDGASQQSDSASQQHGDDEEADRAQLGFYLGPGSSKGAAASQTSAPPASTSTSPAIVTKSVGFQSPAVSNVLRKSAAAAVDAAFRDDDEGDELRMVHKHSMLGAHQKKVENKKVDVLKKLPRQKTTPQESSKAIFLPEHLPKPSYGNIDMRLNQREFDEAFQKKLRKVSGKNPGHEGLEEVRAQVLAEKGIRPRSRSRDRERDQKDYRQPRRA